MIEPALHSVAITDLRPTQVVVGYREVTRKRKSWEGHNNKAEFLGGHMLPAVIGPGRTPYIIDHHHLARALHDEGVKNILISVVEDAHWLKKVEFWAYLDSRSWCHPYDQDGRRIGFEHMPKKIAELRDDPFRSLAGEMRRMGAFAKDATPFSEFAWGDFMRRRIKKRLVVEEFMKARAVAIKLSQSQEARHLPGWCGPEGK
jgi:hypothetical protein